MKSEIRNLKSERNPKTEDRNCRADGTPVRSEFGVRASFGFRHSVFGFALLGLHLLTRSALAGSFDIPAWAFDRGNVKTFTGQWADAEPMVAFGGRSPVLVEYDIDFPASGSYQLSVRYAAANERPVTLFLDGKMSASVCCQETGAWNTSGAKWVKGADLYIPAGKHTVSLQRAGDFPHVVCLRFTSPEIPDGFVLQRPRARKLDDPPPAPVFQPVEPEVSVAALRRAIRELSAGHGARYPQGEVFLRRLDELEAQLRQADPAQSTKARLIALRTEALVRANPLLDFGKLLLVKRSNTGPDLGLPRNWESNSSLPKRGYEDLLCVLTLGDETNAFATLFKPERDVIIGDVDLNWDADKLLFSSVGTNGHWQVFELGLSSPPRSSGRESAPSSRKESQSRLTSAATVRQVTGEQPDVDSYDACYLPDGRIVFTSTACFIGVPCVYGSSHVANLYLMDKDGRNIRQLCFDQEHDWCPTVLNNGRVLYTRWEYTDTPHSNTRLLFHANPDGTEQMEFLGSNSYWPNSFFYARPIPGHPSMVIAVIGGHHDNPRMGELVLFDPARGRQEASPAVQRIPGHGQKVEAVISDGLTLGSWPKFLHPFPLSEKFFLVSCKPEPDAPWGIYLVDVFDNLVPLAQLADAALFEPIPLRPTPRPPVIPDKVDLKRKGALVIIQDIYEGDGLRGVPRGTVKSLRLFTYHFAYQNMGGLLGVVGADGPWDIKRVLGTVPVEADGSAKFFVPANTPISLQPLDAEGKAIQLMRSWMTAMPGETVQCTGCHERQNTAPLAKPALALNQPPASIEPWYGPVRGFSYAREVQPVIDRHCVGCHNPAWAQANSKPLCDLRGDVALTNWTSITPGNGGARAGRFSVGYNELQRWVRRNGIEGDYHVLTPMEFHADTTDLVQLLKAGHYGVELDAESWDRLITWIDLNAPYHGTWGEQIDNPGKQRERRRDLLKLYANVEDDPEGVVLKSEILNPQSEGSSKSEVRIVPAAAPTSGWAFDAAEATRRQAMAASQTRRKVEFGNGISLELVLVPAGEFVVNDVASGGVSRTIRIEKPFWMAARETDNRTFAAFDPAHDSGLEDKNTYQFGVRGYPQNQPDQPVVRVSWERAMAFCEWLSAKTGERFTLPTEAQWEWACRAGADTPFSFGGLDADFSQHANLADATLSEFASDPYTVDVPLKNPTPFDDWIPKDARFNDGALVTVAPARYRPNAWGLHDMHGNAAEWTRSEFAPGSDRRVVRGGSWRDVPARATASSRLGYHPWQKVYNVTFRVALEPEATLASRAW
jgi:formylglycine-generating enzyme required for sulfatase activity